jgi:hypothetical protein
MAICAWATWSRLIIENNNQLQMMKVTVMHGSKVALNKKSVISGFPSEIYKRTTPQSQ